MSAESAILACLLIPAIGALLVALTGARPNLRESVTLVTAVALFCMVLVVVAPVSAGGRPEFLLIEMFPGLAWPSRSSRLAPPLPWWPAASGS